MKKNICLLTSIIASQALLCSTAFAQSVDSPSSTENSVSDSKTETEYLNSINLVSGSLIESKTAGGNGSSAQLSFTSEGSVASLKIAQDREGADCYINSKSIASCNTKS